ncbi:hypothetical protein [[Phormidium] sp. ETS-05]|uniref:hypothetical protein n=1 Tax=[Phormidium] sp. ETS-05 TaxID=222819 RepID=UPI0018EF0A6F|nr:hypothetical protein [[Phormidium] sp. ETS-05]
MGFLYRDITGKDPDSGQYDVYSHDIYLGKVIKVATNVWLVVQPGSNTYEEKNFSNKEDAAKHLAKLADIQKN